MDAGSGVDFVDIHFFFGKRFDDFHLAAGQILEACPKTLGTTPYDVTADMKRFGVIGQRKDQQDLFVDGKRVIGFNENTKGADIENETLVRRILDDIIDFDQTVFSQIAAFFGVPVFQEAFGKLGFQYVQ